MRFVHSLGRALRANNCKRSQYVATTLLALLLIGNSCQVSLGQQVEASASVGGGQAQVQGSVGSTSGSLSATTGSSSSSIGGGGGSASASVSTESSTSASSSVSGYGSPEPATSVSASVSLSTPRPEGLLSKVKDMFKEGKEMVKSSVENLTGKESGVQVSGSVSTGSASGGGVAASAQVSTGKSEGSGTGGGLMDKLGDMAKKGKDMIKDTGSSIDDKFKSAVGGIPSSSGTEISINTGNAGVNANVQTGRNEGPIDKIKNMMSKGTESIKETVHKLGDKAGDTTEKIGRKIDENLIRPATQAAENGIQLGGSVKLGSQTQVQAKVNTGSLTGGVRVEPDKSAAVDLFDKMHEAVKSPVEQILKPIDQALGYQKDPLIRMYDTTHELVRKPISLVTKPVESMLSGAFKTSDESRRDSERMLASDQERREAKLREEIERREGRSVAGMIADRTLELAEKQFEIILKPVDHMFGFDKDGKRNPLIKLVDDIYSLSKKPVDAVAKPFENILRRMAEGEQGYQVSVRFNSPVDSSDPKLFTRLADGALNIADTMITRPLEIVLKPWSQVLGLNEHGHKSLVDAAHSLKNATKVGFELFTRPIDRIIKEIADIGATRDEGEREVDYERKRQEASRLVHVLDKLHEAAQAPWELVLRPMDKVLGYSKNNRKDPLLRAWDIIHQVLRTPIQVVSKSWEEAILGEQQRRTGGGAFKAVGQSRSGELGVSASVGVGNSAKPINQAKKNFIVEEIKRMEKFATKPLDVITSPFRKLILGEDSHGVAASVQAKAGPGGGQTKLQTGGGSDKIVKQLEQFNNLALKPLEVFTQPISDLIMKETKMPVSPGSQSKKLDAKVQSQTTVGQGKMSVQAQVKKN